MWIQRSQESQRTARWFLLTFLLQVEQGNSGAFLGISKRGGWEVVKKDRGGIYSLYIYLPTYNNDLYKKEKQVRKKKKKRNSLLVFRSQEYFL